MFTGGNKQVSGVTTGSSGVRLKKVILELFLRGCETWNYLGIFFVGIKIKIWIDFEVGRDFNLLCRDLT